MADALRAHAQADVGLMPAGAIRADLEAGEVTREEVMNVFPFTDKVSVLTLPGNVLMQVIEKSLSLEYGLAQFSGLRLTYDSRRPIGSRLITVNVGGEELNTDNQYRLVTGSFTANGGENYRMFEGLPLAISEVSVSDALMQRFNQLNDLTLPALGRQTDLAVTSN